MTAKILISSALWLHLPVGAFCALLIPFGFPLHAVLLSLGFMGYEFMEDWRIQDRSYRDVFGFLVGFGLATAAVLAYKIWITSHYVV